MSFPTLLPNFNSLVFKGELTVTYNLGVSFEAAAATPLHLCVFNDFLVLTRKNGAGRPMLDIAFFRDNNDAVLTFGAFFKGELVLITSVLVFRDLTVHITKDSSETTLTVSGAAVISDRAEELLVLQVEGTISSSEDMSLDLRTTGPWVPLPSLIQGLLMPGLSGNLMPGADKSRSLQVRTAQGSSFSPDNVLDLSDWVL